MKAKFLATIMAAALALGACTANDEQMGQVIGGVAGGFLGSQFGEGSGKIAATIGGALIGSWVGTKVAQGMNAQDRAYYDNASQQAQSAPIGQTVVWNNPESGASGTVTPVREGESYSGEYCREFQQTVTIDGQTERAYGTACRQEDGSWRIVN